MKAVIQAAFVLGITLALGSASWLLAQHVNAKDGGFVDFWLGSMSIICGVGAIVGTVTAIIAVAEELG